MQILASALPGFRDLRAPVLAGYLWLIFAWVVLKPNFSTRPANGVAAAVYDLAIAAGPLWVSLAIGVGAYLIGSISQTVSRFVRLAADLSRALLRVATMSTAYLLFQVIGLPLDWIRGRRNLRSSSLNTRLWKIRPMKDLLAWAPQRPLMSAHRALQREKSRAAEIVVGVGNAEEPLRQIGFHIENRFSRAASQLRDELTLPATLLIGNEPQLFSEVDRIKAESQLRFAIVPPLGAFVGYLGFVESSWWWFALIPVAVFAAQGANREDEYVSLMASAAERNMIPSQAINDVSKWVDELQDMAAAEPKAN